MVRIPNIDYKAFLIQRKFPGYQRAMPSRVSGNSYTLPGTSITNSIDRKPKASPANDKISAKEKWAKLLADVRSYREELDELSEDELRTRYEEEVEKQKAEEERERFFNKPSADADFDYWAKLPLWSLDEGLALAFGKSPKVVNKKSLSEVFSWTSPFVREYEKVAELARRSVIWETLHDPTAPILFIKWARDIEVPLPKELIEKVEARSGKLVDWKSRYDEFVEEATNGLKRANAIIDEKDRIIAELQSQAGGEKSLGTRERESLLKLIIAMAVDGYGYEIGAKRSPIPPQIADALARRGTAMDVGTVRKWLNEASEHFPGPQDDEGD